MKENILLILIIICVVWGVWAADYSNMGSSVSGYNITNTTPISSFTRVFTTDFQGTVSRQESGTLGNITYVKEIRNGQWINEDGGTFEGKVDMMYSATGGQQLSKSGNIVSPTFQGTIQYNEFKNKYGKIVTRNERHSGVWYIKKGSKLTGNITMQLNGTQYYVIDNRL